MNFVPFDYKLSQSEMVQINTALHMNTPTMKKSLKRFTIACWVLAAIPVILLVYALVNFGFVQGLKKSIFQLVSIAVFTVLALNLSKIVTALAKKQFKESVGNNWKNEFQSVSWKFKDEQYIITVDNIPTKFDKDSLVDISDDEGFVQMYAKEQGAVLIVPHSAFKTLEQRENFIAFVKENERLAEQQENI